MHPAPARALWIIVIAGIFGLSLALGSAAAPALRHVGHGSCWSCHPSMEGASEATVSGLAGYAPAAQEAAPRTVPCDSCHTSMANPGTALNGRTGTYSPWHPVGGCLACHDPHRPDAPYLLRTGPASTGAETGSGIDVVSRHCGSCHSSMVRFRGVSGYIRHPVGVTVPRHDGHVVTRAVAAARGELVPGQVRLPLATVDGTTGQPEDVIGCTTCHFPHGSANAFSLRWAPDQMVEGCASCHRDVIDQDTPAPIAGDP